jgi:hypothetical protein
MIFLNGALLVFLAALGIPLLLHLLHPGVKRQETIPTLRFLQAVASKRLRSMRLRRLWLLLLRTLILLSVILAFARPLLQLTQGCLPAGGDLYLLFDNSFATQQFLESGETLFDRLRKRAQQVIRSLPDGTQIHLLPVAAPCATFLHGSQAEISDALKNLQATFAGADLNTAFLQVTQNHEHLGGRPAGLLLLSAGFPSSVDSLLLDLPATLNCVWMHETQEMDTNRFPQSPSLLTKRLAAQSPIELALSGSPSASSSLDATERFAQTISLSIHGTSMGKLPLREATTFRFQADSSGFLEGQLQLSADACLMDNTRRFVLHSPPPPRVLLMVEHSALRQTLETALRLGSKGRADLKISSLRQGLFPDDCDVCVLAFDHKPPEAAASMLKDCLQAGMRFVFLPGESPDLLAWNAVFQDLNLPSFEMIHLDVPLSISQWDLEHSLLKGLVQEGQSFERPLLKRLIQPTEPSQARRLAWRNTHGLLYEFPSILFFTSSFLPTWSDLGRRGLLAPLLLSSVQVLGAPLQIVPELSCGQPSLLPLSKFGVADQLVLHHRGESYFVEGASKAGWWRLPALLEPGFASLTQGDQTLLCMAVNPPLHSLGYQAPSLEWLETATATRWAETMGFSAKALNPELALLLLALGLMGLELFLSRGGKI